MARLSSSLSFLDTNVSQDGSLEGRASPLSLLGPCFKHLWNLRDAISFAAVSNKAILLSVYMLFFYVLYYSLCCTELHIVTCSL